MTGTPFPTRPAARCTVYVGSRDRAGHAPLAVTLVRRARQLGLAGATVFRAHAGIGHSGRLHRTHLLAEDAPETVVVVDRPERVAAFVDALGELAPHALVVVDDVTVVEL